MPLTVIFQVRQPGKTQMNNTSVAIIDCYIQTTQTLGPMAHSKLPKVEDRVKHLALFNLVLEFFQHQSHRIPFVTNPAQLQGEETPQPLQVPHPVNERSHDVRLGSWAP